MVWSKRRRDLSRGLQAKFVRAEAPGSDDEIAILGGLSLLDLTRYKKSEREPDEYGFHWPILLCSKPFRTTHPVKSWFVCYPEVRPAPILDDWIIAKSLGEPIRNSGKRVAPKAASPADHELRKEVKACTWLLFLTFLHSETIPPSPRPAS